MITLSCVCEFQSHRHQPNLNVSISLPPWRTAVQIEWINAYHSMIMERVGPELIAQKRMRAYNWLVNKTACIGPNCAAS